MDIPQIRKSLERLLHRHYELYLEKLRDWFSQKITKRQFDKELANILQGEVLHLHNQLLMAILAKSLSLGISPSPTKKSGGNVQPNKKLARRMAAVPQPEGKDEYCHMFVIKKWKRTTDENCPNLQRRFPQNFANTFQVTNKIFAKPGNAVPNITHGINCFDKKIGGNTFYEKIFKAGGNKELMVTSRANLYGRFLAEAWKRDLESVHPAALHCAIKATLHHVKHIIITLAKHRKAFRLREGRSIHSIGVPYPNPYLLQGHHLYEDVYSSDTAGLAEVMQIPAFLSTQEERERLAALEVAASVPLRYSKLRSKATLTDVLEAVQDPEAVPNVKLRVKLLEKIVMIARGYGETYDSYPGGYDIVPKTVFLSCPY